MWELRSLRVDVIDTVAGVVVTVDGHQISSLAGSKPTHELSRTTTIQLDPESSFGHWALSALQAAAESI